MSDNRDAGPADDDFTPLFRPAGSETQFFPAVDGTRIRYMIWPSKDAEARGGVILLPGRSEFIEKYFETVQDLLGRGFWVASMDWRGQGLSDRPLANRSKHYLTSFAPMVEDLHSFFELSQLKDLLGPRIILAHSMGAHVALRFLHDQPLAVRGAVLSAPMIDLSYAPFGKRLTQGLTLLASGLGFAKSYAPGQTNYGALQRSAANMRLLTSDRERFLREHHWIAKTPDLALGGVTFGWLKAAMASIDRINAPKYPEAIETALLIVQAGADRLVDNPRQKAFARRLPNAVFTTIDGARHELLNERDEYRDQFLAAFDRQAERWLSEQAV